MAKDYELESCSHEQSWSRLPDKRWQLPLWFVLISSSFPNSACPTQALRRLWCILRFSRFFPNWKLGRVTLGNVPRWQTDFFRKVMCRSNRSFNIPPPGIPRAFDTFVVPGRRGFDYQSLPGGGEFDLHAKGLGNLNRRLDFIWNLWPLCTWRAIMAGTRCASNVDCILTDWQVNEVNIVVKYSNRFPIPKLDF